jgi:hypothetical protein
MRDDKLITTDWNELTKNDKLRGLIGWGMIAVIGVATFKLGKRSGRKNA